MVIDDELRFSARNQIRDRILPRLCQLDGIEEQIDEVQQFYDLLSADDLAYDLREDPPFISNLCAYDASFELGLTIGKTSETTGVRYSVEPTIPRRRFKNRYTAFRDRVMSSLRAVGEDEAARELRGVYAQTVTAEVTFGDAEPTATIAAIHHYPGRAPRLKAYFSCDWLGDPDRSASTMRALVEQSSKNLLPLLIDAEASLPDDVHRRMVGLDLETGKAPSAKTYFSGQSITNRELEALFALCDVDDEGRRAAQGLANVGPAGDSETPFDLVALGLDDDGRTRLKLYVRTAEEVPDALALANYRAWLDLAGLDDIDDRVLSFIESVGPRAALEKTDAFFNYFSVDVGRGVEKTSVYIAPQILLAHLAIHQPDALPSS